VRAAAGAVRGALIFALAGLLGYSVWALAGRRLPESVLYASIAAVFLVLPTLAGGPLVGGTSPRRRFALAYVPSFLAYAAAWCAAWFSTRSRTGEWIGSAGGCAAFALVSAAVLGGRRSLPAGFIALFGAHSAGYFAGDQAFAALGHSKTGMLAWGVLHGAGLGAGIGALYRMLTRR
jgi:hypothetical protein